MTTMGSTEERILPPAVLPSIGTVKAIEDAVYASYEQSGGVPESLELDFSKCTYVELASLIFIVAIVADRERHGLETRMRLPASKDVRDFFRIWNLPEAIRKATGIPFASLVINNDLKYFGENAAPSDNKYTGRVLDDGITRLLSDRFFAILTFQVDELRSRTRLVTQESERWEQQLVKSVLSKHVGGPDGYVASRIIFESMMNAVRHPEGSIIQTGSRLDGQGDSPQKAAGHLTVVFWDDGQSMVDTLGCALRNGKQIRAANVPALDANYRVTVVDKGRKTSSLLPSSFVPQPDTTEALVLVAALFPGITRDVEGKGHEVHPRLKEEAPALALPGMGLHVLVNTVVDVFGGSLAFRTKNFFMNVKKAKQGDWEAKYSAKIERYDDSRIFLGNMLTIRLPLAKDVEK